MTSMGVMGRFFSVAGLVVTLGAASSWLGCSGGGPGESAGSQGSAGGACFPNGTCDSGLTCSSGTCTEGSSSGGGSGTTTSSSGDGGTSAPACTTSSTCNAFPTLHPNTTPGVYCPFTATPGQTCVAGQTCCDEPAADGVSTCNSPDTACPSTALSYRCMGDVDCQGSITGGTCCFTGTPCEDTTCGYFRIQNIQATVCATSCTAGQFHACEATSQCTGSQQCIPTKTAGDEQMGVCF